MLDMRSDPEFSGVPEAIHFTGEVFSEWAEWITSKGSLLV